MVNFSSSTSLTLKPKRHDRKRQSGASSQATNYTFRRRTLTEKSTLSQANGTYSFLTQRIKVQNLQLTLHLPAVGLRQPSPTEDYTLDATTGTFTASPTSTSNQTSTPTSSSDNTPNPSRIRNLPRHWLFAGIATVAIIAIVVNRLRDKEKEQSFKLLSRFTKLES